eukprot:366499-Chlamydomonas_euryale.AAC.2
MHGVDVNSRTTCVRVVTFGTHAAQLSHTPQTHSQPVFYAARVQSPARQGRANNCSNTANKKDTSCLYSGSSFHYVAAGLPFEPWQPLTPAMHARTKFSDHMVIGLRASLIDVCQPPWVKQGALMRKA